MHLSQLKRGWENQRQHQHDRERPVEFGVVAVMALQLLESVREPNERGRVEGEIANEQNGPEEWQEPVHKLGRLAVFEEVEFHDQFERVVDRYQDL